MVLKIALVLLIALGVAGFGGVAWVVMRPNAAPDQQAAVPAVIINALTAARSLPIGTMLAPEDVAMEPVSSSAVPADIAIDTPVMRSRLTGSVVQRALAPGQPITASDVVFAGSHGALAIMLRPGMVAATIAVDTTSGANLLAPGDYVDVLLTQVRADPATPTGRKVSTELVMPGLRVLAVDQRSRQGPLSDARDVSLPRTVTLETTDDQAQRLSVAAQLGHVGLIIRPASSDPAPRRVTADATAGGGRELGPVVWSSDASQALGSPASAEPKTVHVYRGAADEKEFKF